MKTIVSILLVITFFGSLSFARDKRGKYDIKEATSSASAKSILGKDVKLYWAKQKHPKIKTDMGTIKTNKKTNAFNKSDKEACQWVLLSALKQLQQRARSMGANAIVNIKSNYKNQIHESPEVFECGAGALIAGVALVGTAAKISDPVKKANK